MEVHLFGDKGACDRIEGEESVTLRAVMPTPDDEAFLVLRYIDPHDTTIFNSLQMTPFLAELDRLLAQQSDPDSRRVLEHLYRMAQRCQERAGNYLRFLGD